MAPECDSAKNRCVQTVKVYSGAKRYDTDNIVFLCYICDNGQVNTRGSSKVFLYLLEEFVKFLLPRMIMGLRPENQWEPGGR